MQLLYEHFNRDVAFVSRIYPPSHPPFFEAKLPEAFKLTNATVSLLGRRKLRWRTRQELLFQVWTKVSSLSCIIQIPNRIKWNIGALGTSSSFHPVIWQRRLCAFYCFTLFKQTESPLLLILVFGPFVCPNGPFIQNYPIAAYVFRHRTIAVGFCVP